MLIFNLEDQTLIIISHYMFNNKPNINSTLMLYYQGKVILCSLQKILKQRLKLQQLHYLLAVNQVLIVLLDIVLVLNVHHVHLTLNALVNVSLEIVSPVLVSISVLAIKYVIRELANIVHQQHYVQQVCYVVVNWDASNASLHQIVHNQIFVVVAAIVHHAQVIHNVPQQTTVAQIQGVNVLHVHNHHNVHQTTAVVMEHVLLVIPIANVQVIFVRVERVQHVINHLIVSQQIIAMQEYVQLVAIVVSAVVNFALMVFAVNVHLKVHVILVCRVKLGNACQKLEDLLGGSMSLLLVVC